MSNCYEETFRTLHHECDPWGRMTPGAVLRRVQETSTQHCITVGLTDEVYQSTGTVFLLARISLQINSMPCPGDMVRIVTCAYPPVRAQYHRVTSFYSADGSLYCEAYSYWVLVDVATRRILRRPPEDFPFPFDTSPDPAREHDTGFEKPAETSVLAQREATYSLCDKNGHINNASYADLVCDHLPLPRLQPRPLRRIVLVYRTEIPLGALFTLSGAAVGDDGFYIAAGIDGLRHFEAFAEF